MKRMYQAALIILTALLMASPAFAGKIYLRAEQADIPATSGCDRLPGIDQNDNPYVRIQCNTGESMVFNITLPDWVSDAMQVTAGDVDWMRGDATSGKGCWEVQSIVFREGQLYAQASWQGVEGSTTEDIPAAGATQVSSFSNLGDVITDNASTACTSVPSGCRDRPYRVMVSRLSCTGDASGAIDFIKLTLTLSQ